MINYQIIENPRPLMPYFVEHNDTGEREVCELFRGTWQRVIPTGKLFFGYEKDVVAAAEAHVCPNCQEWAMYPAKYGNNHYCENCVPF